MELRNAKTQIDAYSGNKLSGYAAVFNKLSENLGGFREKIMPGAFANTLMRGADVRLLLNHEGLPLARTKSGTLKLSEDSIGLFFETELELTDPDVQRIIPKLKRKDLNQMSFGFCVVSDTWDHSAQPVRTLLECDLFDISIVTYPAYPQTNVAVRTPAEVYNEYTSSGRTSGTATSVSEIERLREAAHRERQLTLWRYTS